MKLALAAIFAFLICQLANAQSNFFPLLCCSNRNYTNATIETVTPATVTVFWNGGGERISITNLSPDLQTRYHYNPQEAKTYLDKQAAKKAAVQERVNQGAAALAAAQNTLGPAQKIRIVKPLIFPNSFEIEAEGNFSEAYIPNLPPGIIPFIADLDQAQAKADSLKQAVRQARYNATQAEELYNTASADDLNWDVKRVNAQIARNNAKDLERDLADAEARSSEFQSQAKDRTTIIARPTGKMITNRIRQ